MKERRSWLSGYLMGEFPGREIAGFKAHRLMMCDTHGPARSQQGTAMNKIGECGGRYYIVERLLGSHRIEILLVKQALMIGVYRSIEAFYSFCYHVSSLFYRAFPDFLPPYLNTHTLFKKFLLIETVLLRIFYMYLVLNILSIIISICSKQYSF